MDSLGIACLLWPVLLHNPGNLGLLELPVDVLADREHRSQTATAHAVHRVEAELEVRRGLTTFDLELALQRLEQSRAARDVARRTHADMDLVLSHRLQRKSPEESGDRKDGVQRCINLGCDLLDHLTRQIGELVLTLEQDG